MRNDRRRAALEALVIGCLMAAVVSTAIVGVWRFAKLSLERNYRSQLTALAETAALQVDPELHRQFREAGDDRRLEYASAVLPLRKMRAGVPGIRYIHTVALEGNRIRVVLDASEGAERETDHARHASQLANPDQAHQAALLAALGWRGAEPRAGSTEAPYRDQRGAFMTGYAPILDARGNVEGAVAVDFDASDYLAHFAEGRERMVTGILPAALMIVLLTYVAFGMRWRALVGAREVQRGASAAKLAAREDKLTGLANRTGFVEHLHKHVAGTRAGTNPPFAVMFLDFDHFKYVNDTLGHDAGDELLRQIAQRLRESLDRHANAGPQKREHVVARFGGDEFVILLDDATCVADVRAAADGLVRDLAPTYELRGVNISSSASMGIVLSVSGDDDAESLLRNADVAMYEAKRSGRGCYVIFDEAMRKRLTRVLQLERSLHAAIGTPEIRLVYQPIVELDTGRPVAVEALLRWRHPTLGDVPPADFLPMAEETGLIVPLGEWVLHEACRQLAEWQRLDPARAPQVVNVNVSCGEFALGSRLFDRVRSAIERAGIPPGGLQIEVPERVLMHGRNDAIALLEQLRGYGVRLSMDEFGTGLASLVALGAFRFDTVKVARSFVRGLATNRDVMALTHATLTLVENLGMSSIAQGVEDPAQLAILQSFGCRYAEGRLLGGAVEPHELLDAANNVSIERLEIAEAVLSPASAA